MEVFMNYIELINNFWTQHRRVHFSDREICMFFYLLDRANELYWPVSFSVPCNVFKKEFDWTRNQVRWTRDKLAEAGVISYSGGQNGKNGEYSFAQTVLYASHAQVARNSCATSALVCDSTGVPLEEEDRTSHTVDSNDSARMLNASHAQVTRDPRARTLYINKTKLNQTKEDQDILSPDGETKTEFSDFTKGEGNITAGEEKGQRENTAFSHLSSSNREVGPEQGLIFSPLESSGDAAPIEAGPPLADLPSSSRPPGNETARACSKYELEVIQTWETLIGPFDDSWIASLREVLEKCYPSQVKSAILVMAKSRLEVMKEVGFTYIAQPLIDGMFGKRGKKNGRNDRAGSGEFESDIEKFKNPARARPKTREELLKYTMY